MDPHRFDAITKTLAAPQSRRTALRVLTGLGTAVLPLARQGVATAAPFERVAAPVARVKACQSFNSRTRVRCLSGQCKAPGASCGVFKGDGIDHSCCSGICVERGECSARNGCSNSGCGSGVECCYGYECDGSGNCVAW